MNPTKTILLTADRYLARLTRESTQRGKPPCCSAGCSACCSEPVMCSRVEAENMLSALSPEARAEVTEATRAWLAKVKPSGLLNESLPSVFKWRELKAVCPFLKNNLCRVYDDRPYGCRLHMAIGTPIACMDDELRRHQQYVSSPEVDSAVMLSFMDANDGLEIGNLGEFLAELLLDDRFESADRVKVCRGKRA